jgi:hypothetical protein
MAIRAPGGRNLLVKISNMHFYALNVQTPLFESTLWREVR